MSFRFTTPIFKIPVTIGSGKNSSKEDQNRGLQNEQYRNMGPPTPSTPTTSNIYQPPPSWTPMTPPATTSWTSPMTPPATTSWTSPMTPPATWSPMTPPATAWSPTTAPIPSPTDLLRTATGSVVPPPPDYTASIAATRTTTNTAVYTLPQTSPTTAGNGSSDVYVPPPPQMTVAGMPTNFYAPPPTSPTTGLGISGTFPQVVNPDVGVATTTSSKRKTPTITRILDPLGIVRGGLTMTTAVTTEAYTMVVKNTNAVFEAAGFEPVFAGSGYEWKIPKGPLEYPPHLAYIPSRSRNMLVSPDALAANAIPLAFIPVDIMNAFISSIAPNLNGASKRPIFDSKTAVQTFSSFSKSFGGRIWDYLVNNNSFSVAAIENYNKSLLRNAEGIFTVPNIGEREDWFTDAIFAQQHLTGPNPSTVERASIHWVQLFRGAAEAQTRWDICQVIDAGAAGENLYVQDYSDFRSGMGLGPQDELKSLSGHRYGCASVCLFQLGDDGRLHPLAIIIDWRGRIEDSVVIFNRRSTADTPTRVEDEASDWPWRYAKTCVQSSDWVRHEVSLHLTRTHFIEEAVIVSACRSFTATHPVFRLLEPHWFKTLSLNAAARAVLVPAVVVPLAGCAPADIHRYIRTCYDNFHWTQHYIPNDLSRRGFPPDRIMSDSRYRNCGYARNMLVMWGILHRFVSKYLCAAAPDLMGSDQAVAADEQIRRWCEEMRSVSSGAGITTFPIISTREELIDAVVMCINIASPQHTAVNYLQEYYQSFVINKPPAFYSPLPTSLHELNCMTEQTFLKSLPVHATKKWTLASHLPHLLNVVVAPEENLIGYARSLRTTWQTVQGAGDAGKGIADAADQFVQELEQFRGVVDMISRDMTAGSVEYRVLDPEVMALSILI